MCELDKLTGLSEPVFFGVNNVERLAFITREVIR